jgi:hypothetical protein
MSIRGFWYELHCNGSLTIRQAERDADHTLSPSRLNPEGAPDGDIFMFGADLFA